VSLRVNDETLTSPDPRHSVDSGDPLLQEAFGAVRARGNRIGLIPGGGLRNFMSLLSVLRITERVLVAPENRGCMSPWKPF
jgi:hypothetical protein